VGGHQKELMLFDPTPVRGFGILGDSNSDEYRADNNRGGKYAATTLNWMELLVLKRGLNFGPWGDWGEPRRSGYKYNWARSGATVSSMLSSGQHTGLAEQVANGEVSYVLVWIGTNDFHPDNGTYREIYDGTLNDQAVQAKITQLLADLTTAMDTVLAAGDVKIIIVTIADPVISPDTLTTFPDTAGRQRVTDAINEVNLGMQKLAAERGLLVADAAKFTEVILSHLDEKGRLMVGGQQINFLEKGDEPHHMILGDAGGHIGTVASGLVANAFFIEPFIMISIFLPSPTRRSWKMLGFQPKLHHRDV
jgi:lysophospholipase L1-like esterase